MYRWLLITWPWHSHTEPGPVCSDSNKNPDKRLVVYDGTGKLKAAAKKGESK